MRTTVALAAGSAPWESRCLEVLAPDAPAAARVTLLKRCLDLGDLLATATTGTVRVALVAHRLPGLDADSVERLRRAGVRTVVVVATSTSEEERARLRRLGVVELLTEDGLEDPAAVLTCLERAAEAPVVAPSLLAAAGPAGAAGAPGPDEARTPDPADVSPAGPLDRGRTLVVWGPHGAPGRTTVAVALAAEAASHGVATTLVDADPWGGSVAQHLAVLDEASGLLAAARLVNAGRLDEQELAGLARQVAPRWRLVTGLPRPDRWVEVRPSALTAVLEVAAGLSPLVVVDAGFGLDVRALEARSPAPTREHAVAASLEAADDVVVVASADPVGLTRLARSLLELRELRPQGPERVVVNRMRRGLGWDERDVVDMVARVAPDARVAFLPEDRAAADTALVAGRTLAETGDGELRRALAALAREHLGEVGLLRPPEQRRRRPGRVRRSAAGRARSR